MKENLTQLDLKHLNGDARKFVEGLIRWELIKDQDKVMIFCEIMKEAKSKTDQRSYVMVESLKRIGTQIDIYNYAGSFGTVSGSALVALFNNRFWPFFIRCVSFAHCRCRSASGRIAP